MSAPPLMLAALELAINRYLRMDPLVLSRLEAMSGKVIGIELKGLGIRFHISPAAGGVQLLGDYAGVADTLIRGAPLSMVRLGMTQSARGLLFGGDVEVSGDAELGRRFEEALREIDIDWEEQLSRITGDVVAHQTGNLVRGTLAWGERTLQSLGDDLTDYLQEERGVLPAHEEISEFLGAVDDLRADTDRLEARLRRLHRRRTAGNESRE